MSALDSDPRQTYGASQLISLWVRCEFLLKTLKGSAIWSNGAVIAGQRAAVAHPQCNKSDEFHYTCQYACDVYGAIGAKNSW